MAASDWLNFRTQDGLAVSGNGCVFSHVIFFQRLAVLLVQPFILFCCALKPFPHIGH
jgi:hypothetical protein